MKYDNRMLTEATADPWELCGETRRCSKGVGDKGGCFGGCGIAESARKQWIRKESAKTVQEVKQNA